jgi:hypothetical protein
MTDDDGVLNDAIAASNDPGIPEVRVTHDQLADPSSKAPV